MVRQAIRFLDFENTKTKTDELTWNFIAHWTILTNACMTLLMTVMFQNKKYNKLVMMLFNVLNIACACIGFSRSPGIKENQIMLIYIPMFLGMVACVNRLGHHFPEVLNIIIKKNEIN